jgi:hypothetical protein
LSLSCTILHDIFQDLSPAVTEGAIAEAAVQVTGSVVDDTAQALAERDALCGHAFLGYAKADLLLLDPIWRTWNKRVLVPVQVKKAMESFQKHGMQRYVPKNRIPIVIRREWVDESKLRKNVGSGADDLPEIVWKGNGHLGKILGASGQHRFEAVKETKEQLRKQLIKLTNEREGLNDDDKDELASLDREIAQLKGKFDIAGMWGFAIYDYGAFAMIPPLII